MVTVSALRALRDLLPGLPGALLRLLRRVCLHLLELPLLGVHRGRALRLGVRLDPLPNRQPSI